MIYRDLSHRQQQAASYDTEPHTAIIHQQDDLHLQTDQQLQVSPSPAYEVPQSGAFPGPEFLAVV